MNLELEGGESIENPDAAAIARGLASLSEDENGFAILEREELWYMQTAVTEQGRYALEYQEGSLDAHYRATEDLPLQTVIDCFQRYLRGDDSWRSLARWEPLAL